MTHAYSNLYLENAMNNLAEAFHYAVYYCDIDIDYFMHLFINSGYAENFSKGNPNVRCGMSGTELVMNILREMNIKIPTPNPKGNLDLSEEYWVGWVLAYYQWQTGVSFDEIHRYVSMEIIRRMYYPLHEASEEKFVDSLNEIIARNRVVSKLQHQRKISGLSQRELALQSGVNLRTLQQYETRAKDINKASVQIVLSMTKTLGCDIEDILEPTI